LEHSNRGKKSIGIDLTTQKGIEVVYELAATCDVFLTNKLPAVRQKLHVEKDDIRDVYQTHDGRFVAMSCLPGFHYWPGACRAIDREDLITDERFTSHELLAADAGAAREILASIFALAPLSEWRERLVHRPRQSRVREPPQVIANGYVAETHAKPFQGGPHHYRPPRQRGGKTLHPVPTLDPY